MEISPIPGIRMVPAVRTPPVETALQTRFEIDASARAGDDSYTGSSRKGAGAEEEEEELEEAFEVQVGDGPSGDESGSSVSFFA